MIKRTRKRVTHPENCIQETVEINGLVYSRYLEREWPFDDPKILYFELIDPFRNEPKEKEKRTLEKANGKEILCGKCLNDSFYIGYEDYRCIATCSKCGEKYNVYSG